MAAEVGGIIAEGQSRNIECAVSGVCCNPVMIDCRTSGRDHFERLRCTMEGLTFRRVWIGGYAR